MRVAGEASGSGVGGGASAAAPGDKKDELVDAIADSTTQVSVSRRSFNPGLVNNASVNTTNLLVFLMVSVTSTNNGFLRSQGCPSLTLNSTYFLPELQRNKGPMRCPPIRLDERHR